MVRRRSLFAAGGALTATLAILTASHAGGTAAPTGPACIVSEDAQGDDALQLTLTAPDGTQEYLEPEAVNDPSLDITAVAYRGLPSALEVDEAVVALGTDNGGSPLGRVWSVRFQAATAPRSILLTAHAAAAGVGSALPSPTGTLQTIDDTGAVSTGTPVSVTLDSQDSLVRFVVPDSLLQSSSGIPLVNGTRLVATAGATGRVIDSPTAQLPPQLAGLIPPQVQPVDLTSGTLPYLLGSSGCREPLP